MKNRPFNKSLYQTKKKVFKPKLNRPSNSLKIKSRYNNLSRGKNRLKKHIRQSRKSLFNSNASFRH